MKNLPVKAIIVCAAAVLVAAVAGQAAPVLKKLTPAQDAYFPKSGSVDAKLWTLWNMPLNLANSVDLYDKPVGTRIHTRFTSRQIEPLCRIWRHNIELWGGKLVGGCDKVELNPKLPEKSDFQSIEWHAINPFDHIDFIRASYIASQSAARGMFSGNGPDAYWRQMAPIIKRLLERGQVRMAEAWFDADNSGSSKHVYAITLLPSAICLNERGTKDAGNSILYMDPTEQGAKSFNHLGWGGDPFIYLNHTYYPFGEELYDISPKVPGTREPRTTTFSICGIAEKRSSQAAHGTP